MIFNIELVYVENNEYRNADLKEILRKNIKRLHSFHNGKDALLFIRNNDIDAIISDLCIPDLSGLELAEKIRKTDKNIPVIILSSNSDSNNLLRAFELGVSHFIVKPVDSEKLFEYLKNITDNIIKNKELEKAWKEAKKADEAKGNFLSTISHEIRTPMNSIIGMTEILRDTPLSEEQKEYLSIIRYSSEGLLQIINDVLDQSKIDQGHMKLEFIPVNLNRFFAELESQYGKEARLKGLDFSMNISPSGQWTTISDPVRLRQIMINLLSNAIKFTEKGSIRLHCHVSQTNLLIEVKDSGIGIQEDKQKSIFDHFQQADSSITRKYGGTGLGLSITRRIVELMEGSITLNSKINTGSQFICSLPLVSKIEKTAENNVSVHNSSIPDLPRNLKLLIVEDNPENKKVMELYLKNYQWIITFADNGLDAVEACKKSCFDIIFMDIEMPVMDGYDAAIHIRSNPLHSKTPIIALTAHRTWNVRERCLMAGMSNVVNKPVKKTKLLEVLHTILSDSGNFSQDTIRKNGITAVFNPEDILKKLDLNKDELKQITTDFIENWSESHKKMTEVMKKNDKETFHKIIHYLKSSMGYFGSQKAFQMLKSLSTHSNPDSMETLSLYNDIVSEVESVKESYRQFFAP